MKIEKRSFLFFGMQIIFYHNLKKSETVGRALEKIAGLPGIPLNACITASGECLCSHQPQVQLVQQP